MKFRHLVPILAIAISAFSTLARADTPYFRLTVHGTSVAGSSSTSSSSTSSTSSTSSGSSGSSGSSSSSSSSTSSTSSGPPGPQADFVLYSTPIANLTIGRAPVGGQFTVQGGTAPYSINFTGLPSWIAPRRDSSDTWSLTGDVVSAPQNFTYTATATDSVGAVKSYTQTVSLTPLTLLSTGLSGVVLNEPVMGGVFTATGGTPPYAFSFTGLPSWLSYHPATSDQDVMSGTAQMDPSPFTYSVEVTDAAGSHQSYSQTVTVAPNPLAFYYFSQFYLSYHVGDTPSAQFRVQGGIPPYTAAVTSYSKSAGDVVTWNPMLNSPPWFSIAEQLDGTDFTTTMAPTSNGNYYGPTVTVTDAVGTTIAASYDDYIVNAAPHDCQSSLTVTGVSGATGSQQMSCFMEEAQRIVATVHGHYSSGDYSVLTTYALASYLPDLVAPGSFGLYNTNFADPYYPNNAGGIQVWGADYGTIFQIDVSGVTHDDCVIAMTTDLSSLFGAREIQVNLVPFMSVANASAYCGSSTQLFFTFSDSSPLALAVVPLSATIGQPVVGGTFTASGGVTSYQGGYYMEFSGLPSWIQVNPTSYGTWQFTGNAGSTPLTFTYTATLYDRVGDMQSYTQTVNLIYPPPTPSSPLAFSQWNDLPPPLLYNINTSETTGFAVTGGTPPYTAAITGANPASNYTVTTDFWNRAFTVNETNATSGVFTGPTVTVTDFAGAQISNSYSPYIVLPAEQPAPCPSGDTFACLVAEIARIDGVISSAFSPGQYLGLSQVTIAYGVFDLVAYQGYNLVFETPYGLPSQGDRITIWPTDGNYTYDIYVEGMSAGDCVKALTTDISSSVGAREIRIGTNAWAKVGSGTDPTSFCGTSTVSMQMVFTNQPPLTLTETPIEAVAGQPITGGVFDAAGGVPGYSINVTGQPNWLNGAQNSQTEWRLYGTAPTTGGTFSYTFLVVDAISEAQSYTQTFTVVPLLNLAATPLALPDAGVATTGGEFTVDGGTPPYTMTITPTPPSWLTFSQADATDWTLSGTTPNADVNYSYVVTVTDAGGQHKSYSQTVNFVPPLALTETPVALTTPGAAVTGGTFSVTGGVGPYTMSFSGLPSWLTSSQTDGTDWTLAGPMPNTSINTTYTATVTDSTGASKSYSQTLTYTPVAPDPFSLSEDPVVLASAGNPTTGGVFTVTGGTSPYSATVSGLPSWLTLVQTDATHWSISGTTPSASVNATYTFTAIDSAGGSQQYTQTLNNGSNPLVLTETPMVAHAYVTTSGGDFTVSGGTPGYNMTFTGLPANSVITQVDASHWHIAGVYPITTLGCTIGSGGSGCSDTTQPFTPISFTYTATATDAAGGSQSYTQTVDVIPPISISAVPVALTNSGSATTGGVFTLSGGFTPYTLTFSGLPSWLTATQTDASTWVLTGTTPSVDTTVTYTATGADVWGVKATYSQTLTYVAAPFSVTAPSNANVANTINYTLSNPVTPAPATTGTFQSPLQWTVASGTLPTGLRVDSATGKIVGSDAYGMPLPPNGNNYISTSGASTHSVSLMATDATGQTATTDTFNIVEMPPDIHGGEAYGISIDGDANCFISTAWCGEMVTPGHVRITWLTSTSYLPISGRIYNPPASPSAALVEPIDISSTIASGLNASWGTNFNAAYNIDLIYASGTHDVPIIEIIDSRGVASFSTPYFVSPTGGAEYPTFTIAAGSPSQTACSSANTDATILAYTPVSGHYEYTLSNASALSEGTSVSIEGHYENGGATALSRFTQSTSYRVHFTSSNTVTLSPDLAAVGQMGNLVVGSTMAPPPSGSSFVPDTMINLCR